MKSLVCHYKKQGSWAAERASLGGLLLLWALSWLLVPSVSAAETSPVAGAAENSATPSAVLSRPENSGPDTAVICPAAFREALGPWLDYRRRQGHRITVLDTHPDQRVLRAQLRQVAAQGSLRYVVLVGDAVANGSTDTKKNTDATEAKLSTRTATQDAGASLLIPTQHLAARANIPWGGAPDIACDNWYVDWDDDKIPDAAIGRLTADTPAELSRILEKTIAYEQSADFGSWRRRANFVAGVGGFGLVADRVLDSATRTILNRGIPQSYAISMTHASWTSPYCPHPLAFHRSCTERLNQGCLFWVYIGHGHPLRLDRLRTPKKAYSIFEVGDVSELDCRTGSPIAVFLACHTGAFDKQRDCLAEELLRREGGPVAVLAGSRMTMPYGMAVLGNELIDEVFQRRAPTLGEAIYHAQSGAAAQKPDDRFRATLDLLAATINPKATDLTAEREETIHQFNLLGDPLLRLTYPKPIALTNPPKAPAGSRLVVSGRCDVEGTATVELAVPRGRLRFRTPARGGYDESPEILARFAETYREANDPCHCTAQAHVEDGQFQVALDVPATAHGKCRVRVYVQGDGAFALGASDIEIVEPADSPKVDVSKDGSKKTGVKPDEKVRAESIESASERAGGG